MCHARKKFIQQKKTQHKKFFYPEKEKSSCKQIQQIRKKCASPFLQVIKACSRVPFFDRKEKEMDVILAAHKNDLFSAVSSLIKTLDWF